MTFLSKHLKHAFFYPANGALDRNKSNVKLLLSASGTGSVKSLSEGCKKGSNVHGALGASFKPRPATVATTIQSTQLSCAVTSPPLLSKPLPPTGHPEACWNTMPVLAQAPTSGPNVEVTSSGKNGIVSVEKHNTLETLVGRKVLRRIQV